MLFQNRKNKILFGPNILNGTYQKCLFWFRVFSIKVYAFLQRHSREFKYPRRHFALGSISFSMKINDFWWFFDVFRVLPDPLQDLRVDFFDPQFRRKSIDFRVFFACFLTHCETGVLIFRRSISMKNRPIFACFSRAFWSIARPACWFFDDQWVLLLRGASGSSTLRTT